LIGPASAGVDGRAAAEKFRGERAAESAVGAGDERDG
jgi:hypothetical protein